MLISILICGKEYSFIIEKVFYNFKHTIFYFIHFENSK